MSKQTLVTGGAGFIGSHLCDRLLGAGHRVRVLDNLCPQVHGAHATRPAHLHPEVELQIGDVRDAEACRRAVAGVEVIYHLAASVGVGQSMYQIADYTSANNLGTANLLEAAIGSDRVRRLVVASSMSVYGEGLYRNERDELVASAERSAEDLERGLWDLHDQRGNPLEPVPTSEGKTPSLASVYALSKYDQERLCLLAGRAYGISTVALRLFNVYGPRQALSNPYTGVLAIFAARLLNDRPPLLNEDGRQRRDFVSVHDVADAMVRSLEVPARRGLVLNIGSGKAHDVHTIAERMARILGKPQIQPTITGNYRVGDIRHCFADIGLARQCLGYEPRVNLEDGMAELALWLEDQAAVDRIEDARQELVVRGLAI